MIALILFVGSVFSEKIVILENRVEVRTTANKDTVFYAPNDIVEFFVAAVDMDRMGEGTSYTYRAFQIEYIDLPLGTSTYTDELGRPMIKWTAFSTEYNKPFVAKITEEGTDFEYTYVVLFDVRDLPEIKGEVSLKNALEDEVYTASIRAEGTDLTYTLEEAPEGMSIDGESGVITWEPTQEDVGIHEISVIVTDGIKSDTATKTVEVENVNDAPQIRTSTAFLQSFEEAPQELIIPLEAFDEDGDDLEWEVLDKPKDMVITSDTIKWNPKGNYEDITELVILVYDGKLRDTLTIPLDPIKAIISAPVLHNPSILARKSVEGMLHTSYNALGRRIALGTSEHTIRTGLYFQKFEASSNIGTRKQMLLR